MTHKKRIQILDFAIQQVACMHGSKTGDKEFDHLANPVLCGCIYGVTIRGLEELKSESENAIRKNTGRRKKAAFMKAKVSQALASAAAKAPELREIIIIGLTDDGQLWHATSEMHVGLYRDLMVATMKAFAASLPSPAAKG